MSRDNRAGGLEHDRQKEGPPREARTAALSC